MFLLKKSLSVPCLSRSMHDPENPLVVSETLISETVNTSNVRCELEPGEVKDKELRKVLDRIS